MIIVADKRITCNNILALMIFYKYLPVSPTAPPNNIALSLPMGVIVWPNLAMGLSPSNLTYYIFRFSFSLYIEL